jgi:hypothetical protein
MMNICVINKYVMVGSQLKYPGMLMKKHNCELVDNLKHVSIIPDIAYCNGDHWTDYKQAFDTGIPYILSEHDVFTLRTGITNSILEKEMIENAACIIFTSEDHLDYCKSKYNLPPYEIIYLRPSREDLDFQYKPKLKGKHLVYAGGIVPRNKKNSWYGYRTYHDYFQSFMDAGWTVHVYPHHGIKHTQKEYERMGCITHRSEDYRVLLREMSQYTAGLQSYNKEEVPEVSYEYTQTCRPNKLWDYLAAGIPTIGYNPGNGRKIYEGKWGIVIDDLDYGTLVDLDKKLPSIDESVRLKEVMDEDKDKFDNLVRIALEARKTKYFMSKKFIMRPNIQEELKHDRNIKVIAKNTKDRVRQRAEFVFNAFEENILTLTRDQYKEISACRSLKIIQRGEYNMAGETKRIIVKNTSHKGYIRGGRLFRGHSTTGPIEISPSAYLEIKACKNLEIEEVKYIDEAIKKGKDGIIEIIDTDIEEDKVNKYLTGLDIKELEKQASFYEIKYDSETDKDMIIQKLTAKLLGLETEEENTDNSLDKEDIPEEQVNDNLSIDELEKKDDEELKKLAKDKNIEHYWTKGRETLIKELIGG